MNATRIDAAAVAKIARKRLHVAFPGISFSVQTARYAGGSSIHVHWTDGPTSAQVEAVVSELHGASFDGMVDLKEYHESELDGAPVRFGNDYMMCQRKISAALLRRVAADQGEQYGFTPPVVLDSCGSGYMPDAWSLMVGHLRAEDIIMRAAFQTPT